MSSALAERLDHVSPASSRGVPARRMFSARPRLQPLVRATRATVLALGLLMAVAFAAGGFVDRPGSMPADRSVPAVAPSLGLQAVAQRVVGAADRGFWITSRDGGLVASGGGISSTFDSAGVRVTVAGGAVDLRLAGVGFGDRLARVSRAVTPVAAGNLVRYRRGALVEWYRNGPFGLEQGFTLARRPAGGGAGPLTLTLAVEGSLVARRSGAGIAFVSRAGVVRLRYGGLRVTDASGRQVRAALALSGGRVLVRVWDRDARYPLTIDPYMQVGTKLLGDCTSSCSGPNGTGESGSGYFGASIALSSNGDTALIGAPYDNSHVGAAWVFTLSDGTWSQQGTKLVGDCTSSCSGPNGTGETGYGELGSGVAISGDANTAMVGGPGDSSGEGAVWVFTLSGSTWSQQGTKLVGDCTTSCTGPHGTGEPPYSGFGAHIALSDNGATALIGDDSLNNDPTGTAWVFTLNAGTWSQQGAPLVGDCTSSCSGPNGTGEVGNGLFGDSVSLSSNGETALIGAPRDNSLAGAAWVFTVSDGTWSQQGTPLVGDCTSSCSGPNGTGESAGDGFFGQSVALSGDGDTALIGASLDSSEAGAAWVFTVSAGTWSQQGTKLVGDCTSTCSGPNGTGESGDGEFGYSAALSGDGTTALIGAATDDGQVGAAWVFATASSTTAPAITSASSTTFVAGTAGSFTVDATGTPGGPTLTLSDGGASLPSGVTFVDNGNGTATLSGTPAAGSQGSYPFTITAANDILPNATQAFTLTVDPAGSTPTATISTGTSSAVTATAATLGWTVQPYGDNLYYYTVDCVPVNGSLLSVHTTATTPTGAVPADNGQHPLATSITGLRPGTAYSCVLQMGDSGGHSFESAPGSEDITTLTPSFAGFTAVASAPAELSWAVDPEGDSLTSYAVACSSSAGNASASGNVSAGVLPADEASHTLTVSLSGLTPGTRYSCILSLTDADGLTFSDAAQTFTTSPLSLPTQGFSNGSTGYIAIEGSSCGGSFEAACSGSGEVVETPSRGVLARTASAGSVVLGRFKFRIKAHHHRTIAFKLTPTGHKLLLAHHSLATTLIVTVTFHGKQITTRTPLTIVYSNPKTHEH